MTWQRIEGITVDPEVVEGQEARIADPLWLLSRQWQAGELTGEDAGEPDRRRGRLVHAPITRFRPGPPDGGGAVVEREALGLPLEAAVEREPVRTGPAARAPGSRGRRWQLCRAARRRGAPRAARDALRAAFRSALAADDGLDPVGRAQLELLARRAFDARARCPPPRESAARSVGGCRAGKPARPRSTRGRTWYAGLYSEPPAGAAPWDPQRMEYRFRVAAGPGASAELQLDAPEYTGGHLDWYTFDVAPRTLPARRPAGALEPHDLRVLPTTARYAGQAASRLWQVEDAARLVRRSQRRHRRTSRRVAVGGFGLAFGDDWFQFPCRLPLGSFARAGPRCATRSARCTIRSCAERDGPARVWRFFELTGDASADAVSPRDRRCPWMLLPPVLPGVTESRRSRRCAAARRGREPGLGAPSCASRARPAASIDRAARARAGSCRRPRRPRRLALPARHGGARPPGAARPGALARRRRALPAARPAGDVVGGGRSPPAARSAASSSPTARC